MVDSLCCRLARQSFHAKTHAKSSAHQSTVIQAAPIPFLDRFVVYQAMQNPAFINTLRQDWSVGFKLWQKLTNELQEQVVHIRNQHLPMNSGEERMLKIDTNNT